MTRECGAKAPWQLSGSTLQNARVVLQAYYRQENLENSETRNAVSGHTIR